MGVLEYFRRKKQPSKFEANQENEMPRILLNEDKVTEILEEEIKHFFPNDGSWKSYCFDKPSKVSYGYLPCHLRDNDWMSRLLQNVLKGKDIYIPQPTIKNFIDNSESFADLRHEHELRIVKWQINWMLGGGDNWLLPKGTSEVDLLVGGDVDKIFRAGVVKTLKAIGMDSEVVEEGIEKYADIWRPSNMSRSYSNLFNPVVFNYGFRCNTPPEPFSAIHKRNWMADREYKYYQEHKDSVDKYGIKTPAMQMTKEEHDKLVLDLKIQNDERSKYIAEWKTSTRKPIESTTRIEAEDVSSK